MRRVLAFALLLALGALPANAALPSQTDARTDPVVNGPLSLNDEQCSRATERLDGQLVAYTRTCIRLYTFSSAQETDVQKDYGVVWLQSNVNAENGWCATQVRTDLRIPGNVGVLKRNPIAKRFSSSPKMVTHLLETNAGGNSSSTGSLRQRYIFYPNRQVRTLVNEGATQRLTWYGSTDKKLFFQTGAVFSWNILTSPGQFRSGLGFRFEKKATC